jgi:hypothetical protein
MVDTGPLRGIMDRIFKNSINFIFDSFTKAAKYFENHKRP